jgi:uncharacterized protein YjbJ (UPF0337 family)
MNKDRVKGAVDAIAGRAKQKTGKLTGNTPLQVKGIAQQIKGKLESAWGRAKNAVDGANEGTKV